MSDPIRAAAREAYRMRHVHDESAWDTLPYLLEEVGEVARAVRRCDDRNLAEEIADVVILLDHLADGSDLPSLAELVARKVAADRGRFEAAS